jgi:hypothetical protein
MCRGVCGPRSNPLWVKGFFKGWWGALKQTCVGGPTVAGGSGSGLVRRAGVQDVSRSRWTIETFLGALPGPAHGVVRSALLSSCR